MASSSSTTRYGATADTVHDAPWATGRDAEQGVIVKCEPELTMSPDSRVSRQPNPTVPSFTQTKTLDSSKGAISQPISSTTHTPVRQDVHLFVNPSASSTSAPRNFGQQPSSLETSVSSSSKPHHQHGVTQPSNRLRTTVFASSSDLAAHYGIPQLLPPAPRPTARQSSPAQQSQQHFDFNSLKNSYLNMLASKPDESPSAPTPADMAVPHTAPAAAPSAQAAENYQELEDLVNILVSSPEFKDVFDFSSPSMDPEQYLTSPMPLLGHDFDEVSPRETPLNDFLNTPLFDDINSPLLSDQNDYDMMTADSLFAPYHSGALFGQEFTKPPPSSAPPVDMDALITMSPETPNLDSFAHFRAPTSPRSTPATAQPSTRHRTSATGTRKGITPQALVPLDAPTQPRKYAIPSATSRKDLPAVFARKRARSQAFDDEEEDELVHDPAPGPNATEKEQIEWKRRQNTLAARKSRKRKLEHQQMLEDSVRDLTQERDSWKTRALTLQSLLVAHGIPFDNFRD